MSRVDDLIAEHCPAGVTFRALGDLMEVARRRVDPDDLDGSTYVGVDNLIPNFGGRKDSAYTANSSGAIGFRPGDILIGNIRPYLKKVWLADRDGGASPDVLTLTYREGVQDALLPKFLYYAIASGPFIDYSMRHAKGAKMPRGDKAATLRYRIPVPPLEIQRGIVSILDRMESLKAELEAELDLRGRQYAFFRDRLLTFREAEGVRWLPMGEVGTFLRGKRFTKADYVDDGIPCIHYGEIYTEFGPSTREVVSHLRADLRPGLRFAKPGDVVIVDVGETVADVGKATAWLGDDEVAIHDHCYVFRHDLDPAFVSYYMQTARFHAEKAKHVARTKVKTLLMDGLARVAIPVPSREEQERIVRILDKFDALVNDLSVGLPAEIAARRKQYEHYRDKLLTFEEAA